ncbi:SHOCT domain-containing protein [Plasticicumulans acidivorans]|uniref:Putative oligomerization/nucleic acid binding protein n=1 Tax=Plasticicumulans acidivorans TaxID=886464 RepID=A0A317MXK2_9GAMM|nr:SHOCT domain-containing protein [Plasticicumulans acidivorans]PWV64429.1 putative oligomerization/nucleic acid binding protein [Plasticicumulans acidivorans]
MRPLSPAGQQAVNDLAQKHGFSTDAVAHMLDAIAAGNGSMAQFNHPEFAGSGQWMSGGMLMLSDMFNNVLKGRVDALCYDLSNLLANDPNLLAPASFQSQSQSGGYQQQGGGGFQQQSSGGFQQQGGNSLFANSGAWWPGDLGQPSSSGAQNDVRYAVFPQSRRLAIEQNGQVTVYDTLDHQIGGVSQQQSGFGGAPSFTSQYGLVNVGTLPIVSGQPQPGYAAPQPTWAPAPAAPVYNEPAPVTPPPAASDDIFATIERLAGLRDKGILSDEEFAQKKAELLKRL